MGSIARDFVYRGYCPVDKQTVGIEIQYSSLSFPNEDKHMKEFFKAQNNCFYLREGKCKMGNDCPIFQAAENVRIEDFSKFYY